MVENVAENIVHIGAVLGFCGFGITMLLGGMTRFLSAKIGGARYKKIHLSSALISFALVLSHPLSIITRNLSAGRVAISTDYFRYLPFYLGVTAFIIMLLMIITSFTMKTFGRLVWISIHRLSIVAFVSAAIHLYYLGTRSGVYATNQLYNVPLAIGLVSGIAGTTVRIVLLIMKAAKNRDKQMQHKKEG